MMFAAINVFREKQFAFVITFLAIVICSCGSNQTDVHLDRRDSGIIHISADESFQPILDSQIKVFESSYPNAKVIVHYKPEADCLRDLANDSIRMVLITRFYSKEEENYLVDSMKLNPSQMLIAHDAVAVILHPNSPDSLLTMTELKEILKGTYKRPLEPVFDGLQATSTIRFIVDSVLRSDSLTSKASAAKSSEGVIDYVSKNPNAIGFIGVNWVGDKEDTLQRSFLKKVKMAHLESTDKPGGFVLPYQANIYRRRYPMVRDLVYILKENHKGLGHGFANFLSGERGQLIFKRGYLMPATMQFGNRRVTVREE